MARVEDRRRAPRVELRSSGEIDLGDYTVPCQLLDVSNGGIALLATEPAPLRAVRVRFQLGNHDAAWTEVEGQVVRSSRWSPDDANTRLWGLRFAPLDLGTRTRVRGFVAARLRDAESA
jgi:hypothetical protein